MSSPGRRLVTALAILGLVVGAVSACGESRQSNGEACLRDDDCLSNICSNRVCVAAPILTTGGATAPPDDEPRLPDGDSVPADAAASGG